jgi:hypothetical protein
MYGKHCLKTGIDFCEEMGVIVEQQLDLRMQIVAQQW